MNINPTPQVIGSILCSDPVPSKPSAVVNPSTTTPATDTSAISPAAVVLNQLSQLQQQNPNQFSQVLTQITDRLNQVAQNASNSGDSQKAAQVSQLATSFENAASSGQLPTVQQLNKRVSPDSTIMVVTITAEDICIRSRPTTPNRPTPVPKAH